MKKFLIIFVLLFYCQVERALCISGGIDQLMRTRKKSACEGAELKIKCPFKTYIFVEKAMYGRKKPSRKMCPYSSKNKRFSLSGSLKNENLSCEARTSLNTTTSECQGKRICQLLVLPKVFGNDPCPGTTKYLSVVYKCLMVLEEINEASTCKNSSFQLHCSRSRNYVIAIFGATVESAQNCYSNQQEDCLEQELLNNVVRQCHKQKKCEVLHNCENSLLIKHACIPKYILTKQVPHLLITTSLNFLHSTTNSLQLLTSSNIQLISFSNISTYTESSYSAKLKSNISAMIKPVYNKTATYSVNFLQTTEQLMLQQYNHEEMLQSKAIFVTFPPNSNASTNLILNKTISPGLYSLNSFLQLGVYIANNMERFLNIILGILSLCLFLTIAFLLCYHAYSQKKFYRILAPHERLLQPRVNSSAVFSRNSAASRDGGRHTQANCDRCGIFSKCCSCRVFTRCFHPIKDISLPPAANYSDENEDVVSVHKAESVAEAVGSHSHDDIFGNYSPDDRLLVREETDIASEYEFPDLAQTVENEVVSEPGFSGHSQSMYNTQVIRQAQPFSSRTEYYSPPRRNIGTSFPAMPYRSATHQTYQHIVAVSAPYSDAQLTTVRAPQNHYVSLQPQPFDDVWSSRRASIYDNSLPRDSLMYEYYHAESYQQELPGTRNINYYF